MPARPYVPYSPVEEVAPETQQPFDYLTVHATPQEMGGEIGAALQNTGQTLGRAAQETADVALKFSETANETNALNALATGSQQQGDLENELHQLKGANAVAAFPDYQKKLQDIQESLASTMTNPQAKSMFMRDFTRYTAMTQRSMGVYVADQGEQANVEALDATIAAAKSRITRNSLIGNVVPDFDDVVNAASKKGQKLGMPKEAVDGLIQSNVGDAALDVIRAQIASGHLDKANQMFQQYLSTPVPGTGPLNSSIGSSANNLGNVKTGTGARTGTAQFQNPATPVDGVILAANTLRSGYSGLTVGQIAAKWAPSSDNNNTAQWSATVSRISGIGVNQVPDLNDPAQMQKFLTGISVAEKSPADRARFSSDVLSQGVQASLSGKQPQFAAQVAAGTNVGLPMLDGKHIAQIQGELTQASFAADRRANQGAAKIRISIEHSLNNASAMIDRGLSAPDSLFPSRDQVDAAYPNDPDRADEKWEEVQTYQVENQYAHLLAGATPDQYNQIYNSIAPDPSKPNTFAVQAKLADAFNKAYAAREKQLNSDPAGYIQGTNAQVAQSFSVGMQDNTKFGDYAQETLGLQKSFGMQDDQMHVLPTNVAKQISQQITSNPAQAPAMMQKYEQQFGSYWPHVWKDLSTLGKLPIGFQAVGIIQDQSQAALLARGLSEQGKNGKQLDSLIPGTDKTVIDNAVNSDVQVLMRSVLNQPGGTAADADGIVSAVKTLAYSNELYSGAKASDAANKAIKAFTENYNFDLPGNPRVPANKASAVTANANAFLGSLSVNNVKIPPIFGQPGMPKPEEYIDGIKAKPTWVTSPNADALLLLDNAGRFVLDNNGNRVTVPFNKSAPAQNPEDFGIGVQ